MFNGQKPHHPFGRFFLYFAERRGPGCCCAPTDKQVGSYGRFSRYAPRNDQLGRPTRSLCAAGPDTVVDERMRTRGVRELEHLRV